MRITNVTRPTTCCGATTARLQADAVAGETEGGGRRTGIPNLQPPTPISNFHPHPPPCRLHPPESVTLKACVPWRS
jgi:hypothetical protein